MNKKKPIQKKKIKQKKKKEDFSVTFTNWIGSNSSLTAHTIFFVGSFLLVLFGIKLEQVLLVLTTVVSLEAIYLAIFIQITVNRNTLSLKNVEEDIDEIQEDIDEIQEDVEEIEKDIDEIQEDVEGIEKDIDDIQEDVEEIEKDIDEIQEDVEEIQEDDEQDTETDKTKDYFEAIESKLSKIIDEVNELKKINRIKK